MKKNSTDIFESTNSNIFNKSTESNSNFFVSEDNSAITFPSIPVSDRQRRLNDYDFNLLREDAYKDISDDLFKLEYKISKVESEIKFLETQIQAACDINDNDLVFELSERKKLAEEDYESLVAIYNDKSLSAKVSGSISNIFGDQIKNKYSNLQNKLQDISKKILYKLPKPFSSIVELKQSLNKLENINRSVNELMSMNIPYGENINKYEQLSKYIIRANEIQGEITRFIK